MIILCQWLDAIMVIILSMWLLPCFCTYFIYRFILYMGENISSKILSLLGRLSMLILCIHIIDLNFDCWYNFNKVFLHLEGGFNKLVSLIWHLTFAILLSVFLAKNKVVRSIFGLKWGTQRTGESRENQEDSFDSYRRETVKRLRCHLLGSKNRIAFL